MKVDVYDVDSVTRSKTLIQDHNIYTGSSRLSLAQEASGSPRIFQAVLRSEQFLSTYLRPDDCYPDYCETLPSCRFLKQGTTILEALNVNMSKLNLDHSNSLVRDL
jgi:hypothetical protein